MYKINKNQRIFTADDRIILSCPPPISLSREAPDVSYKMTDHMRGPGHPHDPENGHPGLFQTPIVRNVNFSTGQLGGFFG